MMILYFKVVCPPLYVCMLIYVFEFEIIMLTGDINFSYLVARSNITFSKLYYPRF
jgi:hypothetical protein